MKTIIQDSKESSTIKVGELKKGDIIIAQNKDTKSDVWILTSINPNKFTWIKLFVPADNNGWVDKNYLKILEAMEASLMYNSNFFSFYYFSNAHELVGWLYSNKILA